MWLSSPQGSAISSGAVQPSSILGMTWRRIGQCGSFGSISEKKCGVIDIASLVPARRTPARSESVNSKRASRSASVETRFFNCHFESSHWSAEADSHPPPERRSDEEKKAESEREAIGLSECRRQSGDVKRRGEADGGEAASV